MTLFLPKSQNNHSLREIWTGGEPILQKYFFYILHSLAFKLTQQKFG